MKVMVINAGSSSLKFQLLEMPEEAVICQGIFERIGLGNVEFSIKYDGTKDEKQIDIKNHEDAVHYLLDALISYQLISSYDEIERVGHRVAHGGEFFKGSVIVDDVAEREIEALCSLAPLHNPANLVGIRAFKKSLPHAIPSATFDTAFHQTMPADAFLYPVPYEWYKELGVRKYGFHGTSHKYVSQRIASIEGENVNTIVCHLGNGGSLCAVKGGESVDTSMGFTPLDGIVMGTRSGSIDPAIIPFMMEKKDLTEEEILGKLNKESGLLGISGISSDMRDVVTAAEGGNERAELAIEMFCKRVAGTIGNYHIELGGVKSIAFTAGIGENSAYIRARIMDLLKPIGVVYSEEQNSVRGCEQLVSTQDSKINVYIIPTNEEIMIARDAMNL